MPHRGEINLGAYDEYVDEGGQESLANWTEQHVTWGVREQGLGFWDWVGAVVDVFLPSGDDINLFDEFGNVINYLHPPQGTAPPATTIPEGNEAGIPELPEFEVVEDAPPDWGDQARQSEWWEPGWDLLTTIPWDVVGQVRDNYFQESTTEPPPPLETQPGETVQATAPTVFTAGTPPEYCGQNGTGRITKAKIRSGLLKKAAYSLGQCNMKYSSFRWFVVNTGVPNTIRVLGLTDREIAFLLLNPIKRRGRGLTAAQVRAYNRTGTKARSILSKMDCGCGPKRTYKRKKAC